MACYNNDLRQTEYCHMVYCFNECLIFEDKPTCMQICPTHLCMSSSEEYKIVPDNGAIFYAERPYYCASVGLLDTIVFVPICAIALIAIGAFICIKIKRNKAQLHPYKTEETSMRE